MIEMTSKTGRTFDVDYKSDISPRLSVVLPIFNTEYTLRQALDSILLQEDVDLEIICVDDRSDDASPQIIDEYASKDERFVIVKHRSNSGYGAAMNDGMMAARGKWLAILEPDDYIKENMFATMLSAADAYENTIDVVKTPYIREIRKPGTRRGDEPQALYNCSYRHRIVPRTQPFNITDVNAVHLLRHHPSIWSAIYRLDFLRDEDIDFVEYPGSGWADNEFFYKTLLKADNIVYVDEPFYVYREETDEEYDSFAQKNKQLPFDRWHSMDRIVKECHLDRNEQVMRSHISKGFTYLGGIISANGEDDELISSECQKMFKAMPVEWVAKETKISPHLKRLYVSMNDTIDKTKMKSSTLGYYFGLAGELVYAIRNNGIKFAMNQVRKVLGG